MIKVIAFVAVAVFAWWLGGLIPVHVSALGLGAIFGVMAAIPALLISTDKRVRHDHYHYTPTETRAVPTVQLTAKPTRYIVVGGATRLSVGTQNKIEVGR